MKTNRPAVRRAAIGATLTAAIGVTAGALFAPAAAADPYPGCIDPVDGVTICVTYPKSGPSVAIASASTDGSLTMTGVLVTLEECLVDGPCRVVSTVTGTNTGGVYTPPVPSVSADTIYTATASWSDEYGRQHHGVQAVGY